MFPLLLYRPRSPSFYTPGVLSGPQSYFPPRTALSLIFVLGDKLDLAAVACMRFWFSPSPADEQRLDEGGKAVSSSPPFPPAGLSFTDFHLHINAVATVLMEHCFHCCHVNKRGDDVILSPLHRGRLAQRTGQGCLKWVIMSEGMVSSPCTHWMPMQSPCQPQNTMVENAMLIWTFKWS